MTQENKPFARPSIGETRHPEEGWTWLHNSTRDHYFRDMKSLCGKWAVLCHPREKYDLTQGVSFSRCLACERALQHALRKEDAEAQLATLGGMDQRAREKAMARWTLQDKITQAKKKLAKDKERLAEGHFIKKACTQWEYNAARDRLVKSITTQKEKLAQMKAKLTSLDTAANA